VPTTSTTARCRTFYFHIRGLRARGACGVEIGKQDYIGRDPLKVGLARQASPNANRRRSPGEAASFRKLRNQVLVR